MLKKNPIKLKTLGGGFFSLSLLLSLLLVCLIFSSSMLVHGTTLSDDDSETTTSDDDGDTDEKEDTELPESDDDDHDGIDDEEERLNERELNFDIQDFKVTIESELKSGETKDEIKVEFDVFDEPKFKLEYSSESDKAEYDLEFQVKLYGIVEYLDSNSDGIFNDSEDQLLQNMLFGDVDFLPIIYESMTTDINTTIHVFNATTANSVFSVVFYVTGEFATINSTIVTPTQIKIDFRINSFPYINDTSSLALQIKLESESEYEEETESEDERLGYSSSEKAVETSVNNFTGYFSWAEYAFVDNQSIQVLSSPVEGDEDTPGEQEFYLNYPHGELIIHDPKIGVTNILRIPSTPSEIVSNLLKMLELSKEGYLGSVTLFTLLVVTIAFIHRRKSR